jgi:zinc/manganese transport system permease protein
MNWDIVDWSILAPALAAGLLVLSTHVPLGQQVLARGIIFIDLAVAQIAGLGVIAAHALGWEPGGWATQAVAVSAALGGTLLLYAAERRFADVLEAVIGCAFVLAAAGGILLLTANPQAGEHLKELLAGQILWVSSAQLIPVAVLYTIILAAWFFGNAHSSLRFYLLFALSVTASVQLVGVYLVFASLILPALATRRLPGRSGLWWGYGIGVIGYAAGILGSALFDLPTGPLIVFTLAGAALLATVLGRLRRRPA